MLRPQFGEDPILTASSCVGIPLPDDDPKAMAFLCQVLHLQNDKIPLRLNVEDIFMVGVLVNKYECAAAFKPHAQCWIGEHLGILNIAALRRLFISAYHFQHAELFEQLGTKLVLQSEGVLWSSSWSLNNHCDENLVKAFRKWLCPTSALGRISANTGKDVSRSNAASPSSMPLRLSKRPWPGSGKGDKTTPVFRLARTLSCASPSLHNHLLCWDCGQSGAWILFGLSVHSRLCESWRWKSHSFLIASEVLVMGVVSLASKARAGRSLLGRSSSRSKYPVSATYAFVRGRVWESTIAAISAALLLLWVKRSTWAARTKRQGCACCNIR